MHEHGGNACTPALTAISNAVPHLWHMLALRCLLSFGCDTPGAAKPKSRCCCAILLTNTSALYALLSRGFQETDLSRGRHAILHDTGVAYIGFLVLWLLVGWPARLAERL
jgi:hypothetical protein